MPDNKGRSDGTATATTSVSHLKMEDFCWDSLRAGGQALEKYTSASSGLSRSCWAMNL
jgi:hypothetical protein